MRIPIRTASFKQLARGLRVNKRGEMNKTEARYDEHLSLRQCAGEVLWYAYEAMRFRLADNTFYCPDFMVMLSDGTLEAHDVKGVTSKRLKNGTLVAKPYATEAGLLRIKMAAEIFPVQFVVVTYQGGNWKQESVNTRRAA